MLTEGSWKAKATSLVIKQASTGKKFVDVLFRLEDGPDRGRAINWQGWLSPKAQKRTIEALNAMGFDGEHLESCKNEVIVVVGNEEYEAEDGTKRVRARVQWVNDPNRSAGFGEELDKGELQETMKELRGLHADAKKPQAANASFKFGHNVDPEDNIKF